MEKKINRASLLASGLGSGFAPRAPGTFGSAAAFLIWWVFRATGFLEPGLTDVAIAIAVMLLGLFATRSVLKDAQREGTPHDDPQWVVIDEWAGMFVALAFVPVEPIWFGVVAFVAFRVFDASKIGPVGWAERAPGAYGVMLDDVVAGLFAALVVQAAMRL